MAHLLRDKVLNTNRIDNYLMELSDVRVNLNELIDKVRRNNFTIASVKDLQEFCSDGFLEKTIEQSRNDYFGSKKLLPNEIKSRDEAYFTNYLDILVKLRENIKNILGRYPHTLQIDSKGHFWFSSKEIRKYCEATFVRLFTEQEKIYYNLLGNVLDAYKELSQYEKENGLQRFTSNGLVIPSSDASMPPMVIRFEEIFKNGLTIKNFASWLNMGLCQIPVTPAPDEVDLPIEDIDEEAEEKAKLDRLMEKFEAERKAQEKMISEQCLEVAAHMAAIH